MNQFHHTNKGDAMLEPRELLIRFSYHPPKEGQPQKYEALRAGAHNYAMMIDEHAPDSREKSLALTNLEEAVMWANAAIARRS